MSRMKLRRFFKQENHVNLAIDKRDGYTSSIKLTIFNSLHSSLWLSTQQHQCLKETIILAPN